MTVKTKRKLILIIINLILFVVLFIIQNNLFNELIENDLNKLSNENTVVGQVMIMEMSGDFINMIIGMIAVLLIVNGLILKYWIKSKRWIIESILIFIFTLIISISYHADRNADFKTRLKHTANNS
jgi:ABC-type Fe3+-siderophore transport system permease subunit